jgi:NAD(P)-dependent dehydrogenase (short-subunit alcohol dehydrogenase family)
MTSSQRVAVVTGSSSGNGYQTSLTLARNGFLYILNQDENIKSPAQKEKLPLKTVQLDVTDDISVKNAIQSITAESSRIDVLVNNAGYGIYGAFEDLTIEEIKAQFETNLFGVIRVAQAVFPS